MYIDEITKYSVDVNWWGLVHHHSRTVERNEIINLVVWARRSTAIVIKSQSTSSTRYLNLYSVIYINYIECSMFLYYY